MSLLCRLLDGLHAESKLLYKSVQQLRKVPTRLNGGQTNKNVETHAVLARPLCDLYTCHEVEPRPNTQFRNPATACITALLNDFSMDPVSKLSVHIRTLVSAVLLMWGE